MAKVLGIGGVFFKSKDPAALAAWYKDVLDLPMADWGGVFLPIEAAAAQEGAGAVFAPFKADSEYFAPSTLDHMVNLMVDDLDGILAHAATHGVTPDGEIMEEPNGRFAHILDPDGRKIELWQPKAWSE